MNILEPVTTAANVAASNVSTKAMVAAAVKGTALPGWETALDVSQAGAGAAIHKASCSAADDAGMSEARALFNRIALRQARAP